MKKRFVAIWIRVKRTVLVQGQSLQKAIERYPLRSFFALLLLLFLLILLGSVLRKPVVEPKPVVEIKKVEVYRIGAVPKVSQQAQIQKSGVITITAQVPGVVQTIPVKEGDVIGRGRSLVSLSTNYYGGNAASLQRQLAQKQYQHVVDTFDTQKDILAKQKEVAQKNDTNNDELRDISKKSIDETKSALSLNEDILNTLDFNLSQYQATNSAGINNALILATKQQKSQFLAAVNQLRSALRNTEFSTDENKPPAQLSNVQKDITLKQLDIQEKALELSREVSKLQLAVAQVNEAMMFPAAPIASQVQRIFVRVGQAVTPGTPLVQLSGTEQHITAVATVPEHIASTISRLEASILFINGRPVARTPDFVSREATHGQLFSIIYTIPLEEYDPEPDGAYIRIDMPIGYPSTGSAVPFIPLDSVFQTQEKAYVFVVEGNKAASREVKLGSVLGRFVQVENGLKAGDEVILDRSVIGGQMVEREE